LIHLHKEFETAHLRASLLLVVPLFVSAVMFFFAGSAMLAQLAVAGGIAVAATYLSPFLSAGSRLCRDYAAFPLSAVA
jgi:hypothetical protein